MESTTVRRLLVVTVVVLTTVVTPGECLVDPNLPNIFYPFGTDQGDTVGQRVDDGFTAPISIPGGFRFFGSNKNVLYVNLNGAFSFDVAYGNYTPTAFPISGYSVIAPYWADVDVTNNNGRLYYRSETGTDLMTRASNDVRATFSTQCLDTFRATWVFIATWHNVTYFGGSLTTPINSFQGVLVSDGTRTFAMFNYGTLTWTTGTSSGGNAAGLGGIAAQVGFNAGNGVNFYVVPDSRTNAIVNIYKQTNVGVTGRWMFRTDVAQIGAAGCVLNPTTCPLDNASGLCVGTGTCSFQGDPHYVTFDGKRFDYQGTCKYLVAKPKVRPPVTAAAGSLPYFEVYARGEFRHGQTTVAYARYVEIVYGNDIIRLSRVGSTWNALQYGVINVTVNGVPVSTPRCGCGNDYSIYQIGFFMRFITTWGLVVEYDGYSQVNVNVPPTYNSGKLTGICGNFDGLASNDATECNGTSYTGTNVNMFGDKCVVADTDPDQSTSCTAPPAPTSPCLTSPPQDYVARCGQLSSTTGPFASCITRLDALVAGTSTQLYNDCILDACLSSGAAICNNVRSLVDVCANLGIQVNCNAWQTSTNCPVTCPAGSGMVFQCNATTVCHPTCNNPRVSATCTRPNRAACVCPAGTLLNNGVCVQTCLGGCVDNTGVFRQANETWSGSNCQILTCQACPTCPSKFQVVTSNGCQFNQVCVQSQCVTPTIDYHGNCEYLLAGVIATSSAIKFQVYSQSDHYFSLSNPAVAYVSRVSRYKSSDVAYSTCSASGDPHYTTFDNLYFTYQGMCKYLVAGVVNQTLPTGFQNFQIFARNERRPGWSPDVTFVRYVEIVVGSHTVRLSRSPAQVLSGVAIPVDLTISGRPFSIPFGGNQYPFKVYYSGSTVRFQSIFGVAFEFDGSWTLTVFVPQNQYFGLTEGICGNNDGQENNDWTLASGTSVRGNANAANLLGDSFIVADPEFSPCPTTPLPGPAPCVPPSAANLLGCSPIVDTTGPFANCINNIGMPAALMAYTDCLFDACYSTGASINISIQTFARYCDNHGYPAPCQTYRLTPYAAACPLGMTFQCSTTSCPASCAELDAPRTCRTPPINSCACPNGQYLYGGRCVTTCPAGCVDQYSLQFYTVGTWWRGTGCTVYTCVSSGNIQTSSCLSDERCTQRNTCVKDVSMCYCQGDPHCATYDNRLFDYQGTCRYLLSGVKANAGITNGSSLPQFTIYSKNEYRYGITSVAWVKYVEIQLDGGDTIRLTGDYQSMNYIAVTALVNFNPVYPPYIGTGYTIGLSGPVVVFRTSFGVRVAFDGRSTLSVSVPATRYSGQLRGLCGNNDGNSVNDFTLFDGTDVNGRPNGANLLGDSFVVPDVGNTGSCPAPPPPSPCDPTTPLYSSFVTRCNVLKNPAGPFGAFIALIGAAQAEIIYNGCILDACFTNGTSICPNIKSFIDLINIGPASISIDSCSVLNITGCDSIIRRCPTGMTYQCNAPGCPATCTNPNPICTLPNWDSCVCPPGTLFHNDQCVSTCPRGCIDDALQLRPIGAVWRGPGCLTYTCNACSNCALGAQTVVSNCLQGELCSRNRCIPPTATCSCDGDPHCTTFDRLRFDYQGTCKYNLVSVKTQITGRPFFRVYARNELRYGQTNVAYVKYVEIIYGSDTVRLTGNYLSTDPVPVYVSLNGFPISVVNSYNGNGYVVSNYGSSVRFGAPSIGLVVVLDIWGVYVTVPNSFVGDLTGLCGNFDGSSANDFTTADGVDVSTRTVSANLVGDSFVIPDPELPGGTQQCVTPAPPTPCTPSAAVRAKCSFLNDPTINTPFGRCIIALGQTAINFAYDACILDACNTNGSSICFSIKSFVNMCNQLGFLLPCDTWQQSTGCDTVFNACPLGMIYQCSTSGCQPTCEDATANQNCALPATSGCVCPTGQLLLNGECTSVCPRGCVDNTGQVRPVGTQWQIDNCQTATCVACPNCLPQFRIQVTGNCCGEKRCVNNSCV